MTQERARRGATSEETEEAAGKGKVGTERNEVRLER